MTTSGSIDYNQTRDQIITDALMLLGVYGANDTVAANDITFCAAQLNKMIKSWQGRGLHLWKEEEGTLVLEDGVNTYTLATSSSNYAGKDAVETYLTASSGGGGTLTVNSTVGMNANDTVIVELDDGTVDATTISSVGSSTTINVSPSVGTAASGNTVVVYTTPVGRPLQILNARYKYAQGTERRLKVMGRTQFMSLSNKDAEGPCTAFFYTPQLTEGVMYVYPTPSSTGDTIKFSYVEAFQDFDASGDNPDFPQEWLECLTKNLAVTVAPAYGISISSSMPDLGVEARTLLDELSMNDFESGSSYIVPNYRYDN